MKRTIQRKRKHFTEAEDELATEFFIKYLKEVKQIEDDYYNMRLNSNFKKMTYKEKIENLELSLEKLYKIRDFCASFGKGGKIYYTQNWEQMFNANKICFSEEDRILESIAYWQEAITIYQNLKEYMLNNKINNENILVQNDLYKIFPSYEKSRIRDAIKYLIDDGIITREKKENKYIITIL